MEDGNISWALYMGDGGNFIVLHAPGWKSFKGLEEEEWGGGRWGGGVID